MWRRTRTPHEEFWGGRQIDIDYRLSHFYFIDLCATSTPCGIIHSLVTVNFLIMKHIGIYAGAVAILVTPAILFAQGGGFGDTWQTLIIVEDSSRMLEMISLWAKLIVAFSTSAMVWNLGRKMHGGVFGSVLACFPGVCYKCAVVSIYRPALFKNDTGLPLNYWLHIYGRCCKQAPQSY